MWEEWSPDWDFDDATFDRSADAHDNPDYVDVVIHSYRHRFGLAAGDPQYAELQRRLAPLPAISVPSVTLDGDSDGVLPAGDGRASASKFTGRRIHRVVPGAGHNVPQEAPEAFAAAAVRVLDDPALRTRLGNEARRTIEQTYAWDVVGGPLLDAYRRLAAPPRIAVPVLA